MEEESSLNIYCKTSVFLQERHMVLELDWDAKIMSELKKNG